MVSYKCASCGAKLDMDLEVLGLTCRVCGDKIFYKKELSVSVRTSAVQSSRELRTPSEDRQAISPRLPRRL